MSTTTSNTTGSYAKRRPARAALMFGVTICSIIGLGTNSASAQSWSATGYPGVVGMNQQYATANGATRQITVNPMVAAESPQYAQYDQYVCFTSRLRQIEYSLAFSPPRPAWVQVNSDRKCGWIPGSATSINHFGTSFSANYGVGYSVTVDVTWQLSNGATIGSKTIGFHSTQDYRCVTGNCAVATTNWAGGAFVWFPNY